MKRLGSLVLLLSLCIASSALAQPTLESGLGGPNGYGNTCLSPNDDGSSVLIDLTSAFPAGLNFFGTSYTSVYVNTNGNLTFGASLSTYTPNPFPIASQPMIAPYWADVDLRGTACSGFGGDLWATCMVAPGAGDGVYWALEAPTATTPGRMIVTWDHVGYFACHDDLQMTFQLILTAVDSGCGGHGDFDVEFRYTQCGWNTGEASGGTAGFSTPTGMPCTTDATCDPFGFGNQHCEMGQCWMGVPGQAGFDAGNLTDYVEIPGSRTNAINNTLCEMSNVSSPGTWRYQIRAGTIICPGAGVVCDTAMPGVCADGRTRCVRDTTECRPVVPASAETCDGLDNDCNGMVDDGSSICPTGSMCISGNCVAVCFEGACPSPLVCDMSDDRCVDADCVGITCPPGERCSHGVCGDACAGITCPHGLSCSGGRCVDLCGAMACDSCSVCSPTDGSCSALCTATSCPAGQTCASDGHCVESACATVTCASGTYCMGGTCVDLCTGVTCPTGQECRGGACIAIGRDAGMPHPDAARPDAASEPDASDIDAGLDASFGNFDAGNDAACRGPGCDDPSMHRRGCSCGVPGQRDDRRAGATLLAIALGLLLARRRR